MMIITSYPGAKQRCFALLYVASFVLSLAPSVVAPPERNLKKGQPELQQAMDNMIVRDELKKRTHEPSSDDIGIPFLLTHKTTHLLEEAESILPKAKDVKEKAWMEDFIQKLKVLASAIEQNVNENGDNEIGSSIVQEVAQSVSDSAVLKRYPLQQIPHVSLPRAIPESRPEPQQSNQTTSELTVTVPESNLVKTVDYGDQHLATKPGPARGRESEDDELVRELESLRHNSAAINQDDKAPETSSKNVKTSQDKEKKGIKYQMILETKKEWIKERMAAEVKELKSLGETDKDILDALHIDGFKFVESKKMQEELASNEVNKFEKEIENSADHKSVKRVLEEFSENAIPESSPYYINHTALHTAEPPRHIFMNNTILGMHITLPPLNPREMRRQFYGMQRNPAVRNFPYRRPSLQNTIQKLQAEGPQNFQVRYEGFGIPNGPQFERFSHYGPGNPNHPYGPGNPNHLYGPGNPNHPYGPGNPNHLYGPGNPNHPYGSGHQSPYGPGHQSPYGPGHQNPYGPEHEIPYGAPHPTNMYPPDHPAFYHYSNSNLKDFYMPYPLNQNPEPEDDALNESSSVMNNITVDPLQADLSEEMRRQLRDGRVILLSDSVVRSNFTQDDGVTEQPKSGTK